MIHIEDAEFEEFILADGDIAVPVEVHLPAGETEPEITVYSRFVGDAEEFLSAHGKDPFSAEALSFWKARLSVQMEEAGFHCTKDADTCIRIFMLRKENAVNRELIQANTRIVTGKDDLCSMKNLTTHALEMDPYDPDDISAIAVEGGAIAAYATLNDAVAGEEEMEISVECAPAFRNRGLATSCAAALSYALLCRGYAVSYKCRSKNAASARVAEKVGFTEAGTQYSFVCYRRV